MRLKHFESLTVEHLVKFLQQSVKEKRIKKDDTIFFIDVNTMVRGERELRAERSPSGVKIYDARIFDDIVTPETSTKKKRLGKMSVSSNQQDRPRKKKKILLRKKRK